MRTLLIACGNTLRRDDGVAHELLRLLPAKPGRELRTVHQLTPELAEDIARFHRVVFLDADAASGKLSIEPIGAWAQRSPLTHIATPAEIVVLARALFGFTGEALLCRIPARDFSFDATPGPDALQFAQRAADELGRLI